MSINFLFVSGLERSGNNCLRDWIAKQIKCLQLANISPRIDNVPLIHNADRTLPLWDRQIKTRDDAEYLFSHPPELMSNYQQYSRCPIESIFDAAKILVPIRQDEALLISNEWNVIEELIPELLQRATLNLGGTARGLILIRDPLNWLASFLKRRIRLNNYPITSLQGYPAKEIGWPQDLYLHHFRKWKNATNLAQNIREVTYSRFVFDRQYRLDLLGFLGISSETQQFAEAELVLETKVSGGVSGRSGGSSWDGFNYEGRAREMDVMSRYKYLAPIKDKIKPELFEISKQYFDLPVSLSDL